jgi:hypothetical protein
MYQYCILWKYANYFFNRSTYTCIGKISASHLRLFIRPKTQIIRFIARFYSFIAGRTVRLHLTVDRLPFEMILS